MNIDAIYKHLNESWNIDSILIKKAKEADIRCDEYFKEIEGNEFLHQLNVLSIFQKHGLSEYHFAPSTGYGLNDPGRDIIDDIMADIFGYESALTRWQIVSGTHAITCALFGILRPGDLLLSITGPPYDTLQTVINKGKGALTEFNISFSTVNLNEKNSFDYKEIEKSLKLKPKLIFIQRSCGYSWRKAISSEELSECCLFIKKHSPETIILLDNCYCEFVDLKKPAELGIDITAGSFIKNPGGGIIPCGGYLAGKKELIELCASRMTAPGILGKQGATLGMNRIILQGIFIAPHTVSEALKGSVWSAYILESMGYEVFPSWNERRYDIIQAVKLNNPKALKTFCQGIQNSGPVDSKAKLEASRLPGYSDPVIMAGGTFIQGSSIELSADAPVRPPYIAYLQGGLTFGHVKIGILNALNLLIKEGKENK